MKPQFSNLLTSSFLLWYDHNILTKGEAYTNVNSSFYRIDNTHNGYYTYSNPYGQILADTSISGMVPFTGVYINGTFTPKGSGGLVDINYNKGQLYFTSPVNGTISGNYSVKDLSIYLTNDVEQRLLIETKYSLRPKYPMALSGLQNNEKPYPSIFINNLDGSNIPLAFGGMDNTKGLIRATILADSLFLQNALGSISRDLSKLYIPILKDYEMPFNKLGGYKSGLFDYNSLTANKIQNNEAAFVLNTYVMNVGRKDIFDFRKLNPDVFVTTIDFAIETYRYPRV